MSEQISRTAAKRWSRALTTAAILLAPYAAVAQTGPEDTTKLADQLVYCAGLTGEQERLRCYDTLARPLLGLKEGGETTAAARHSFTGRDDWDSEPFEVMQPWRVTWQNEGSLLTVELRTEQGEMLDVIGNQIGRGGGRSEVQPPGVYRLAVRGLGGWRVQVVDE